VYVHHAVLSRKKIKNNGMPAKKNNLRVIVLAPCRVGVRQVFLPRGYRGVCVRINNPHIGKKLGGGRHQVGMHGRQNSYLACIGCHRCSQAPFPKYFQNLPLFLYVGRGEHAQHSIGPLAFIRNNEFSGLGLSMDYRPATRS